MGFAEHLKKNIHSINEESFESYSLDVFRYQYKSCEIYQAYCNYLHKTPKNVKELLQIPFLPIEFFRTHLIKSGKWQEQDVFRSSGTTKTGRSQHLVRDNAFYLTSAKETWEKYLGPLANYQLLALLPSYQEQGESSLLAMVDYLMHYAAPESGYFLNEDDKLVAFLQSERPKILIGVTYALLNLAEKNIPAENTLVIETGGMKGRRKEIIRAELHEMLEKGLGCNHIWSEYGMTELFSQAYGKHGYFSFPAWAKAFIRDINDPFSYVAEGKTGGVNVVDLANVDTCSFIETSDLGRIKNNQFEILGRFDNSDIRGCNLLI